MKMDIIRLNGNKMTDKAETHAYLKRKLDLPDYYGNNLDALWDCLSTDFSGKMIVLKNPQAIPANLGGYGESLLQLFQEVAEKNHSIHLIYAYEFNKK